MIRAQETETMTDTTKGYELGDDLAKENYAEFLATIKRNMDPDSNTVLLIDDERAIRMKVARDVRAFDRNIVVFEASNGKEGLEKLAEIRKTHFRDPLLIVLDLQMPIMDGWDVIKHLKKEYENAGKAAGVPILVLSSTSGERGSVPFIKRSVHDGKAGYSPLVTVAKDSCVDRSHYDAAGSKGLMSWLEYFLQG